jgi:hypothetical protein
LFFPIESSHGGLPCGHVAAPSEPASKLVTIPFDPTERDPVHLGWSVVVEADGAPLAAGRPRIFAIAVVVLAA